MFVFDDCKCKRNKTLYDVRVYSDSRKAYTSDEVEHEKYSEKG